MTVELSHEALAETHNLSVGFALGIKVRSALAAAHGKSGQSVLKDLLEAEELDHAKSNLLVETKAALVRTDCGVELYAIAAVYLNLALIIYPRYTEDDDALGFNDAADYIHLLQTRIRLNNRNKCLKDFLNSLKVLVLLSVTGNKSFIDTVKIRVINFHVFTSFPEKLPDTGCKPDYAVLFNINEPIINDSE